MRTFSSICLILAIIVNLGQTCINLDDTPKFPSQDFMDIFSHDHEHHLGRIELFSVDNLNGNLTEILPRVEDYEIANKKVLIVRYNEEIEKPYKKFLFMHNGKIKETINCSKLEDLSDLEDHYDIIFIYGGHLFSDIAETSDKLAYNGKTVIVYALDSIDGEMVDSIRRLIPLSERFCKLSLNETLPGHIHLIVGSMYAGKTTKLMIMVEGYKTENKKVLVVKSHTDTRSQKDAIATHTGKVKEAMSCKKIGDLMKVYDDYDVIAIDEGQFFPDIVEGVKYLAEKGKIVIVAGLDGTYERKPFGNILDLIPIAKIVDKLSSRCFVCKENAPFTKRVVESKEETLVGGAEFHKAVCRKHYMLSLKSTNRDTMKASSGIIYASHSLDL